MPKEMVPVFGGKQAHPHTNIAENFEDLDFIGNTVHDEYTEAYHKGKKGKCATHYSGCSISIFKMLNIWLLPCFCLSSPFIPLLYMFIENSYLKK